MVVSACDDSLTGIWLCYAQGVSLMFTCDEPCASAVRFEWTGRDGRWDGRLWQSNPTVMAYPVALPFNAIALFSISLYFMYLLDQQVYKARRSHTPCTSTTCSSISRTISYTSRRVASLLICWKGELALVASIYWRGELTTELPS